MRSMDASFPKKKASTKRAFLGQQAVSLAHKDLQESFSPEDENVLALLAEDIWLLRGVSW